MFTKNKQNKLRQMKKIEIREESYLKYTTTIKCAFCFRIFFIFHQFQGNCPLVLHWTNCSAPRLPVAFYFPIHGKWRIFSFQANALTDVDFLQFGLFWEFLTNLSPWQEKKSKVALMADRWMDKQDGKWYIKMSDSPKKS